MTCDMPANRVLGTRVRSSMGLGDTVADTETLAQLRQIRDYLRACEKLREKRDRLIRNPDGRYSQRQLARAAGLSPGYVARLRRGG